MEQFSPLSQQDFPIEIVQGETFILPVAYEDSNGSPIDLDGYSALMQIRPTAFGTGDPILELSTENGLISVSGTTGQVQCLIPAGTTAVLPAGLAVYDLFVMSNNQVSERLLFGPVKITERVSK